MAQIVINEISSNYTYNIGANSYATVALPITAAWGPGFFDYEAVGKESKDEILEETTWAKFPANQAGLESFISTYRGPATNYRLYGDYSYQTAITLLTAGYDVLVCRLCPGTKSEGNIFCAENYDKTKSYEAGDDFYYPATDGQLVQANEHIDANIAINDFSEHAQYTTGAYVKYNGLIYRAIEDNPTANPFSDQTIYAKGDACVYEGQYLKCSSSMTEPDIFSDQSTYAIGDLVRYDGTIYTCSTAVETPGAFNSSDWTSGRAWNASEWQEPWTNEFNPAKWTEVVSVADPEQVDNRVLFKAKYPGSFGDSLVIKLARVTYGNYKYWNMITYIKDSTGALTAVENLVFTMDELATTDTILYIDEVTSKFVDIELFGNFDAAGDAFVETIPLTGGDDHGFTESADDAMTKALALAEARFGGETIYIKGLKAVKDAGIDKVDADGFYYREWLYTNTTGKPAVNASDNINEWDDGILYLLTDRLTYNPDRIISPWDDQDFTWFGDVIDSEPWAPVTSVNISLSPMHKAIMFVSYYSRCAAGLIDVPRTLKRSDAQPYFTKLSTEYKNTEPLFATHSAYFAPWGHFVYAGTSRSSIASPSFLKLMIERSQISNQSIQYSWALPTNRKHYVAIGKLDYIVPKKYLDEWQKGEGVNVNAITNIPDLGTNLWGNYTGWSIPPATYNALENLSTRFLVDAIKDVCYRVGISITFQYNNEQAYSKFYAGVTPLLDTMRNVGAIDDYRVIMKADINGLDSVNANSVLGYVYVTVHGVINSIQIDLIALPSSVDLNSISI